MGRPSFVLSGPFARSPFAVENQSVGTPTLGAPGVFCNRLFKMRSPNLKDSSSNQCTNWLSIAIQTNSEERDDDTNESRRHIYVSQHIFAVSYTHLTLPTKRIV